jgi:hypothetical protein
VALGDLAFYALLGILTVDVLAVAWWDVRHMLYVGKHYRADERVERGWREWKDAP